jgi:uncharacterized membrane protein HdeD (DUF308 family)
MERNVGGMDRTARLVLGPLLAVVGLAVVFDVVSTNVYLGGALVVVGAVLLVTGAVQQCPINTLLGVNTCPRN